MTCVSVRAEVSKPFVLRGQPFDKLRANGGAPFGLSLSKPIVFRGQPFDEVRANGGALFGLSLSKPFGDWIPSGRANGGCAP